MPAGQQVTLEPSLARRLRQDLHHAPVAGERDVGGEHVGLPRFRSRLVHRFEPVRRGLVGTEQAKVAGLGVQPEHVAQVLAEHPRPFGGRPLPGLGHRHCVVVHVGEREVAEQQTAVRVRVRAHAPRSLAAASRRSRRAGGRARRTALPAGTCASTRRAAARCSGFSRTSESGTWCARHVPSTGSPSTTLGPVQPFGVRSTIIGQRGRVVSPPPRARCWIARISPST